MACSIGLITCIETQLSVTEIGFFWNNDRTSGLMIDVSGEFENSTLGTSSIGRFTAC